MSEFRLSIPFSWREKMHTEMDAHKRVGTKKSPNKCVGRFFDVYDSIYFE